MDNIMWTSNGRHIVSLDVHYSSMFYCMSYCIGRSIIRIDSLSILRDVITVMQSMSAIFRVTNQLNYLNSCELRNVIIIHVVCIFIGTCQQQLMGLFYHQWKGTDVFYSLQVKLKVYSLVYKFTVKSFRKGISRHSKRD